jgi:hypothetical protein
MVCRGLFEVATLRTENRIVHFIAPALPILFGGHGGHFHNHRTA